MLGEWVGWRRILAICVGFSGVLFVTRPGFGGIHWAVSFSFCATLSYGLYVLWTRYLARFDPAETTQIFSPVAGVIALAPFALSGWQNPESIWVWLLLISMGISGGFGHWLLILAYERAPAPVVAPFAYVSIIFMIAFGFLVFSDIPDGGLCLAPASSSHPEFTCSFAKVRPCAPRLLLLLQPSRKGKRRARARRVPRMSLAGWKGGWRPSGLGKNAYSPN